MCTDLSLNWYEELQSHRKRILLAEERKPERGTKMPFLLRSASLTFTALGAALALRLQPLFPPIRLLLVESQPRLWVKTKHKSFP